MLALTLSCGGGGELTGPSAPPPPAAVGSVELPSTALTLAVGATQSVTATVRDASGNTLAGRTVNWTSRNSSVASVAGGTISGIGPGTTTVIATVEGRSDSVDVTVYVPVATVHLPGARSTMVTGESQTLRAVTLGAAGDTLTGRAITWTSDSVAVATVDTTGLVRAIRVGTVTITAASEGRSVALRLEVRPPVASLTVSPASDSVPVGGTRTLQAVPRSAGGDTLTGRTMAWTSLDTTRARVDSAGVVTGVAAGAVGITVTVEGKSATALVTVFVPVDSIAITPAAPSVSVGGSAQLKATLLGAGGDTLTGFAVAWSSSDTTVARIGAGGLVSGVKGGTSTITASAGGASATATLTVSVPVASVTVAPATASVLLGGTTQLTAIARSASGDTLAGRIATWTSEAPAVATVADGVVTGVALGTTRVHATVEGRSASATVTVVAVPVRSVVISPDGGTVRKYESIPLSVVLADSTGAPLEGRTAEWSSLDPGIASVGGTGRVTGHAVGQARIRAASGTAADTVAIAVVAPVRPATISFAPATVAMRVYDQVTITATLRDSAGVDLTGRDMQWTSSDPAVAQVSGPGRITGLSAGTATITMTTDDTSATVPVTVAAAVPVETVIVDAPAALWVGADGQATVRAYGADGVMLLGRPVTWRSSDTTRAKVSAAGVLTGIAVGSATITATVTGVDGSATIGITLPPVATVAISPSQPTLGLGDTLTLTAALTDLLGHPATGRVVTWTSSDATIAYVGSTGTVRALKEGVAMITATSEGRSASVQLTVGPPAVKNVMITPSPAWDYYGNAKQLSAVLMDANWRDLGARPVTWSSSDPTVATVSSTGLVTTRKVGGTMITATSEGASTTVPFSVRDVPSFMYVDAIALDQQSVPTMTVGKTVQLSGYARLNDGTIVRGYEFGWRSSDTTKLKVSQTGLVTAVGAGTATITMGLEHVGVNISISAEYSGAPVASIGISPSPVYLQNNLVVPVTLVMRDAAGLPLDPRRGPVVWNVGDPNIVAAPASYPWTLRGGYTNGTTSLSATVEGRTATTSVSVVDEAGTSTVVSPANPTILARQKVTLAAVARDPSGQVVQSAVFWWTSSDSSVATVNRNTGEVTGVAPGRATITANGIYAVDGTTVVTVNADYPESIVFDSTYLHFSSDQIGWRKYIRATVIGASGLGLYAPITWSTSDPAVATVEGSDASVTVVARGTGVATITATTGSVQNSLKVGVGRDVTPVANIQVMGDSYLARGKSDNLDVTLLNIFGNPIGLNPKRVVTWSNSDPTVVSLTPSTYDYDAYITAQALGTADLTVTSEGVSRTFRVTVVDSTLPAAYVGMMNTGGPRDVLVGGTLTIGASAMTVDGSPPVNRTMTWTARNATAAGVVTPTAFDNVGRTYTTVTGKAVGLGWVVASLDDKRDSVLVNVVSRMPVRSVRVSLPWAGYARVGDKGQATAYLSDANGSPLTVAERGVTWTTSNASIATVSATGWVTIVGYGNVTITATSEGVSGSEWLIIEPPVASVQVSPNPGAVPVGGTLTMIARAFTSSGAELTGRTWSWSSSNPALATVSNGRVSGLGNGVVTITASSGGMSGTAQVTVGSGTSGGGGGGTGGGGGGTGGGTGSVCSSTTPIGTPAPGQATGWHRLAFPNGLEVQIGSGSVNHGTSSAPKYEYFIRFRNNYTETIYFSYGASTTQVKTSTDWASNVAAGATESEYSIYGPPGTLSLYVAGVRFGSFSAPAYCQ